MQVVVDLHSHSGHAGGVGNISLADIATTMARKGIDVFGTGDCLQREWLSTLESELAPAETGLYSLPSHHNSNARFLLQTEIILTAPVASGGRKTVHTILLLPSFSAAHATHALLNTWGVKLGMGRPFVCCEDTAQVAERLYAIRHIDAAIEVIPAHVLTPQGILGADNPIDRMSDFFGAFAAEIQVVETGLSADPEVLALIPELDSRTLISNSDCHSAALNRVGRECTALRTDALSYDEIIRALRNRNVNYTCEFTPAEGRYFLTGHRGGVKGHAPEAYCYFSPDKTPADRCCPICGKQLTLGVLERALELSHKQGSPRQLGDCQPYQPSRHLVPLVEVIAAGLGLKSITSKKVNHLFNVIIENVGTEFLLWEMDESSLSAAIAAEVPASVFNAILQVRSKHFTFTPLGFDGSYGQLILGIEETWFGHSVIKS